MQNPDRAFPKAGKQRWVSVAVPRLPGRYWQRFPGLTLLATLPILVSCKSDTPVGNGDGLQSHRGSETIDWFGGDLEEAFATAKSTSKPLFLYWGAEWCPPCHVLKNTIFKRPEFIEKMHDFVPAYLDGDTERAQILGEELQVMGYPTVTIFDPLGEEIMRMPSTVSVDQYETVLASAIATMRPVKDVLEHVLTVGPRTATQNDLRLLAFYSWGQDSRVDLSIEDQVAAFDRLRLETPAQLAVDRSRFLGLYLMGLSEPTDRTAGVGTALTESQRTQLREETLAVLSDVRLRNSSLLWITYYADSIIELLVPEDSSGREQLLTTWQQAADALEADASLSVGDRLLATRLKTTLAALKDRAQIGDSDFAVPVALQDHVRTQALWAMETVTDESELQSVINTLAYLLESVGLSAEAETMLLARMNDTVAPYYFMSWLARLKEDAGDLESALQDWNADGTHDAEVARMRSDAGLRF